MATWNDIRSDLNARKLILDDATTPTKIGNITTLINSNIKTFANTAGISSDSTKNQAQVDATTNFNRILDKELEYKELIKELTAQIKIFSGDADITTKLTLIGTLGSDIRNLEVELKNVKQEASTSTTRKESIENPDMNVSWYQGFASSVGFSKPLHQISISILIGFGILLLILSGLMMKEIFGSGSDELYVQSANSDNLFSIFTDSRMYSVLGAITLVIVTLGILSYNGYMGKSTL